MNPPTTIVDALRQDPLLGECDGRALARLLPHVKPRSLQPGEALFQRGDASDNLYLVLDGTLSHGANDHGDGMTLREGLVGEECVQRDLPRLADVVALTAVQLLEIPGRELTLVLQAQPGLGDELQRRLLQRTAAQEVAVVRPTASAASPPRGGWMRVVGWLVTLAAPALVMANGHSWGLNADATAFVAVLAATISMWVFPLVDDYLPGLFAILATLLLGLAPVTTVLSGFASDSFFLAMSVLGMGVVIVSSGLSYRFLLWLLLRLPNNAFGQNAGLWLNGILLTPLVPSANARVVLVAPMLLDMLDILRLPVAGRGATLRAASTFAGSTVLSAVFLSSKSINFVVFGMLSVQLQEQFDWLSWLKASLVVGGVMLLGTLLLSALWFRGAESHPVDTQRLRQQLALLGPLNPGEWAGVAVVATFLVGVSSASIHHIQPPWLALAVLFGLLMFGILKRDEFSQKVDWPFLIYLGGTGGIVATVSALGLDRLVAGRLGVQLGPLLRDNLGLFILTLALAIFVIRLLAPINATVVLLATVFIPMADNVGLNPWVMGMLLLILGEMWFFPYQCSYYLQFQKLCGGHYAERQFLYFNGVANLLKLVAIFATLPYWRNLGVL